MTVSTFGRFAVASLAFVSIAASAADLSAVPSGKYTVDPTHAYINFQYSHLGLSNPTLGFDEFSIDFNLDNADPSKSTVAVSIEGDSIDTGSDIFYEHLNSDKWFDTEKFPKMSFTSTGITANADGTFQVIGDLTIKDVTKPVTLDVTVNGAMMHPMAKKPVVGITASGELIRSDWDLGANVPFISDNVTLSINAELLAAQ